jgi:hypothetical protein
MFAQTPSEELALVIKKAKKGRRPPGASATLACLHESKLQHVDRQRIIEAVGLDFAVRTRIRLLTSGRYTGRDHLGGLK